MKATDERSFGDLLRRHRHAVGLTQEELAERAEISVRQLAYLERDRHTARPGTVRRLADALTLPDEDRVSLLASAGVTTSGITTQAGRTAILPLQPTPFIGREGEVASIVDLLGRDGVRLLTLTGPGGAGKTRLAIQAAQELDDTFPDGIVFVPLASLTDPAQVASAVTAALGVQESAGHSLVETLQGHLQQKRLLLLLDNFEHLLPAESLVSELLQVCPQLTVLVTSRLVLHLAAEHDYAVPPLTLPDPGRLPGLGTLIHYDAVTLFVQRARAAKASFALTPENAPAVVEICRRVDGLPLAIELAAARIRLFPPDALAKRLEHRLPLLTGGARDAPSRQQSLRAAIDWSHSLLNGNEQALFARLSVFAGGCTLDAAEAVCSVGGEANGTVLDGIASLVESSLITQQSEAEPRFVMLETIHEYAAERLNAAEETEHFRRRHSDYFLTRAEEAASARRAVRTDQARLEHLRQLNGEHDNLRAALRYFLAAKDAKRALQLSTDMDVLWFGRALVRDGAVWLESALQLEGDVPALLRLEALSQAAALAMGRGALSTASRYVNQRIGLACELGDPRQVAEADFQASTLARHQGDYARDRHGRWPPLRMKIERRRSG